MALALLVVLLAVLIVPPMVSVSRYKSRITQLMSASLGRPVRLSSVELRLLPRPGFVLNDLTVEEDTAIGAEPVLHANTVTASIRLLSLWRGRLEIGTISVDEASLNLERTADGHWNLDSLFRTASQTAQPGTSRAQRPVPMPRLDATNSRINIKNGAEKLPFSLLNTDLSFWQEAPGDWRIKLKGQPARTDVSLDLADTGMVQLQASLHSAPQLRQMPLHIDLIWKEAQLGQLSKLILGSDPGWRGDLTGELHLDGTADAAQVKTRLRAIGVHRAEFAPAAPLDFDAQCGFLYHFSARSFENMTCDSPLGNGHIRLAGDLPSEGQPHLSIELDKIPLAAGLDALRTVRSDFGPGLEAKGTMSGKIVYAAVVSEPEKTPAGHAKTGNSHSPKAPPIPQGPLTGSFTVNDFQLSGDGLGTPIQAAKLVLEPVTAAPDQPQALSATVVVPAGGTTPLNIATQLSLSGYQVTIHGQASFARARELAHVAGLADAAALDHLAGDPISIDLNASGPWMKAEKLSLTTPSPVLPDAQIGSSSVAALPATDSLSGTLTLHNANWKSEYLANIVLLSQATVHLSSDAVRWDPVAFTYGPVKGTASLSLPVRCAAACVPKFAVQFGAIDTSVLQAAVLGAQESGTLLSTLLNKLHPTAGPAWPVLEGTISADSLTLGPVTLKAAMAALSISPKDENSAEITSLDADLLGGHVHGTGTLHTLGSDRDKPAYTFEGQFEKLNPAAVGALLSQHWSGGSFQANGKIDLTGFTEKDLAASAKGNLHFDWQHGTAASAPAELTHFDHWDGDAEIATGGMTLKQNQVQHGTHQATVAATATLGAGARLTFTAPQTTTTAKR